VAGVYARIDRSQGFYKAPANEVLEGVFDLQASVGAVDQAGFIAAGVPNLNCLRAFPGRGIRVAGARTLSLGQDWLYVNVRRTVMTIRRWFEVFMTDFLFEPNDPRLWLRINREVTAFLDDLHRQGALEGATAPDAYFVKCDAENNPSAVRDAGQVVVEVGLAPSTPREFLVVRLIHGADGIVSVSAGPGAP
jgi:phage tail sheath protein FI